MTQALTPTHALCAYSSSSYLQQDKGVDSVSALAKSECDRRPLARPTLVSKENSLQTHRSVRECLCDAFVLPARRKRSVAHSRV